MKSCIPNVKEERQLGTMTKRPKNAPTTCWTILLNLINFETIEREFNMIFKENPWKPLRLINSIKRKPSWKTTHLSWAFKLQEKLNFVRQDLYFKENANKRKENVFFTIFMKLINIFLICFQKKLKTNFSRFLEKISGKCGRYFEKKGKHENCRHVLLMKNWKSKINLQSLKSEENNQHF